MGVWDSLRNLRIGRSTPAEGMPQVDDLEASALPTYTRIVIEGASLDVYLAIRSGDPSFEFMPPGLGLHIIGMDGPDLRLQSSWQQLRQGREFFRKQLASNVQRAVFDHDVRADFVREEHELLDQRIGQGAGPFSQDNFHSIPEAWVFVTQIDLVHDDAKQLRSAWTAIADHTTLDESLAGPLVALMTARIESGLELTHTWTDRAAGEQFLKDLERGVAAEIAGPHPPRPRSSIYPASYLMINNDLLAEHGIKPVQR